MKAITRYPAISRRVMFPLLFLLVSSYCSFSQETKKFNLKFVVRNAVTKKYVKQIDSVALRNEINGEEWIWDNLQTKDSIFTIEDIELGKYRIIVFEGGLVVPFADFSLCSLCKNKVRLTAYTSTANRVFDRMSIGPHYETGFKQLATDFLSSLTKDEAKILKKSDNKMKVKCFITADDKLSDIIFEEPALSAETKQLIKKGFEKTRNWRCGLSEGKPVDDYIVISVSKLVD